MRCSPVLVLALLALATLATGCGTGPSDTLTAPDLGACRNLAAKDVTAHSNDTAVVACKQPHTAQTFLVGTLPASTGSSYDDTRQGAYVYRTCTPAFARFLGADDSLAMRVQLSWGWFGPSEKGWKKGARWFRCDVLGGPTGAHTLKALPTVTKGLFQGRPSDAWLTCARGATFARSVKLSCAAPHDWRAIGTIKLGGPNDPYPGDRISEVRSRDYCSDAVGAWLNYTPDYEYGYTYFHKAEWQAGNRRSICWAGTDH